MPTTPYKEETKVPNGTGHMDPPPGENCGWLKRHSFGNSITYEQACRGGEVVFIRTQLVTDVAAAPGGGCDLEITAHVTTIHTGRECNRRTFEPVSPNDAYARYVKLEAEIAAREAAEKKKAEGKKKL